MNGVDPPARYKRKGHVFHIMYGRALGATDEEMVAWRTQAARYINGEVDQVPMTLAAFRALNHSPPENPHD